MSYVQIDDFECPFCNKITMAELNIKTGKYRCLKCGKIVDVEDDTFGGVF